MKPMPGMSIPLNKLFELYTDTLSKCGNYLLDKDDETIGYNIFEEFDIGVISFLHNDSLKKLLDGGLITIHEKADATNIRKMALELQNKNEWNMECFKTSENWKHILNLCDKINNGRTMQ